MECGSFENITFTIGFKEANEWQGARELAEAMETEHHEIVLNWKEYFDILPKIAWHFDEPVSDPSAIQLFFLAREARKKVKVVLSGEGADEQIAIHICSMHSLGVTSPRQWS